MEGELNDSEERGKGWLGERARERILGDDGAEEAKERRKVRVTEKERVGVHFMAGRRSRVTCGPTSKKREDEDLRVEFAPLSMISVGSSP